ncbi:MAG: glycine cleavage system protein GcvH [Gammaproteobacteria bacterium]|nr:glycine cleavage system protein GcvH [Gammaproteobacteria bacterium]MDH4253818.1 glycine cleavage system protein GcvH [Gammaproteobacteria bacterium]MDH5311056.1 glycine cleavage system protein GcvH [Gammaproteobacteria bacterium]
MSELPGDLLYTSEHEWLRKEDDGSITIGITDHAQAALGDLVYVELPEVGQEVTAGGEMAVVESVKAASDVYSPLSGEVIAVNDELADDPQKINSDPYGDGWIARVRPEGESEETMTPDEYQEFLDELED